MHTTASSLVAIAQYFWRNRTSLLFVYQQKFNIEAVNDHPPIRFEIRFERKFPIRRSITLTQQYGWFNHVDSAQNLHEKSHGEAFMLNVLLAIWKCMDRWQPWRKSTRLAFMMDNRVCVQKQLSVSISNRNMTLADPVRPGTRVVSHRVICVMHGRPTETTDTRILRLNARRREITSRALKRPGAGFKARSSAVAESLRDAPYRWKPCFHSRSLKVIQNYTVE